MQRALHNHNDGVQFGKPCQKRRGVTIRVTPEGTIQMAEPIGRTAANARRFFFEGYFAGGAVWAALPTRAVVFTDAEEAEMSARRLADNLGARFIGNGLRS